MTVLGSVATNPDVTTGEGRMEMQRLVERLTFELNRTGLYTISGAEKLALLFHGTNNGTMYV